MDVSLVISRIYIADTDIGHLDIFMTYYRYLMDVISMKSITLDILVLVNGNLLILAFLERGVSEVCYLELWHFVFRLYSKNYMFHRR